MAKTINVSIDFDDEHEWEDCYRALRGILGPAETNNYIEGWESSDLEWYGEDGTAITEEQISEIRKKVNGST